MSMSTCLDSKALVAGIIARKRMLCSKRANYEESGRKGLTYYLHTVTIPKERSNAERNVKTLQDIGR